ncbi:hypothetical protein HPB52_000022 [Rhipicephalus sanguineus]|uniref:Uncharacterized protein n=1 Tax=Rhipicephalus sanguineus TaxID=34632 RepID=A0A9D4QFW9_RHISA|nr:hypothetical protein HPB52_000022 [Rhipicephalus sanguineus]
MRLLGSHSGYGDSIECVAAAQNGGSAASLAPHVTQHGGGFPIMSGGRVQGGCAGSSVGVEDCVRCQQVQQLAPKPQLGPCFSCGKLRHLATSRNCPAKQKASVQEVTPVQDADSGTARVLSVQAAPTSPRDFHHGKRAFVTFYVTAHGTSLLGLDTIQQLGLLIDGATLTFVQVYLRGSSTCLAGPRGGSTSCQCLPSCVGCLWRYGSRRPASCAGSSSTFAVDCDSAPAEAQPQMSSELAHGSCNPPNSSGRDGYVYSKSAPDSRHKQGLPAGPWVTSPTADA